MPKNKPPRIPNFAIGEAVPDGDEYVVHLGHPYLVVRISSSELSTRPHLNYWPPNPIGVLDPTLEAESLHWVLRQILSYWARATDSPLPEGYSHFEAAAPPDCLLLDDAAAEWTGILQTRAPRLWEVTDRQPDRRRGGRPAGVDISWLSRWLGPPPEFPADTRATAAFFREFTDLENNLTPPPECP